MEHAFWHARWEEGRIGFHQQEFNRQLQRYWSALNVEADTQVLVPLCGKSRDMLWLREQGHSVVGVELNRGACEAFFAENGAEVEVAESGLYKAFRCDGIELLCGDVFALEVARFDTIGAVYDRAALVALPQEMRKAYAQMLCQKLPVGVPMLLITMEFAGEQGPPFAIAESEVCELYGERFEIRRLGETEDGPKGKDVAYLLLDRSGE